MKIYSRLFSCLGSRFLTFVGFSLQSIWNICPSLSCSYWFSEDVCVASWWSHSTSQGYWKWKWYSLDISCLWMFYLPCLNYLYSSSLDYLCYLHYISLWLLPTNVFFHTIVKFIVLLVLLQVLTTVTHELPDVLAETFHKVVTPPVQPPNVLTTLKAVTNLFDKPCLHQWLRIHGMEVSSWTTYGHFVL